MSRTAARPALTRAILTILLACMFAGIGAAPAAAATTISILYAPQSPIVANTEAAFTAHISPFAAGRTVSWYAGGHLEGQSTTNPNGIASIVLRFGAGGYGITAVLEPIDGVDRAQSDEFLLLVTPDPERLPDRFVVERLQFPTVEAEGGDAEISQFRTWATPTSMWIMAHAAGSDALLNLVLIAPPGGTLEPGTYTGDASNEWVSNQPGCGSGANTTFDILSMERDAAGVPIAFALNFTFQCTGETWPTVGAVRYNSTTPLPFLSLPTTTPAFDSVIEGDTGVPRTYTLANGGETTMTFGDIGLAGTNASAFDIADDGCSHAAVAAGDSCALSVTFAPATSGTKHAKLVIPSTLGTSPLQLPIIGQALVAESLGLPSVAGDNQYHVPGIRYEATIAPNPQMGSSECLVDGEPIDGSGADHTGVMFCVADRPAPGEHDVVVRYSGSPLHGVAVSPARQFTVDPTTATHLSTDVPPTTANIPVKIRATVEFAGDVTYPGGTLSIIDSGTNDVIASGLVGPSSPTLVVAATLAAGDHHLVASYGGIDGEEPSTDSMDIHIAPAPPDITPPTVTAPTAAFVADAGLSAGRVPVRLAWTGRDAGGIDHFELAQSVDGGPWSMPATIAGTSTVRSLGVGGYRFRVRAVDRAGNVGSWMKGPTFRMRGVSESNPTVHDHGTWKPATGPAWWGGTAMHSSSDAATVSYTFTGRAVAWVSYRTLNRGKAKVYVNGVLRATVNLRSTTDERQQIVWAKRWSESKRRTLTIRVLGTAGRPRVDIDGFVTGS